MSYQIIVPGQPEKNRSTHLLKNLEIFRSLGVESHFISNGDLLRQDLSGYDAAYLNWFENIEGGSRFTTMLRWLRRRLQLRRMRKAGLQLIFCKHNRFPHDPSCPALSRDLYSRLCRDSRVIVAFNEDADSDLKAVFPGCSFADKIVTINPVNYIGVYPEAPDSELYQLAEGFAGKLVIGFVGRILPYKNVELLIRAARELSGCPDIVFLIAGEPGSEELGRQLAEQLEGLSNVTALLRRIPDEDMAPALALCHVLAMPYDTRSASNSGAGRLAFSYGRTVISPDISSMNVLPEELLYKYHYDTQEEHYDRLLEQIRRVYADWQQSPGLLLGKGAKLKEIMAEDYSEEAVRRRYEALFAMLRAEKQK